MYELITETYPNIQPLHVSFYVNEPYKTSSYRRCKALVLNGALCETAEFCALSHHARNNIIVNIEKSCYNSAIQKIGESNKVINWENAQLVQYYSSAVKRVADALYDNHELTRKVARGEIWASNLINLRQDVLFPSKLHKEINDRKQVDISATQKTTNMYPCPNCSAQRAYVSEIQRRSADEGKDTDLLCAECHNEWTQRN